MSDNDEVLRNIEAITVDMKELIERELIPLTWRLDDKAILQQVRAAQAALTMAQGLAKKRRTEGGK